MLRGLTTKQHQDQRLEKDSEATFFTTGVATVKSLDCDVIEDRANSKESVQGTPT